MKVKFKEDRKTKYGLCVKGKAITVSKADGEAFIQNGLAKPVIQEKKDNG